VNSTQPAVTDTWPVILSKEFDDGGGRDGYEMALHNSATLVGYVQFLINGANTAVNFDRDIADGGWHHVFFQQIGSTGYVYIDGEFANQNTMASGDLSNAGSIKIASGWDSDSCCFLNGKVDDVRIYNRALSADDITRLYKLGGTTKLNTSVNTQLSLESSLVGHWTFDGKDIASTTSTRTAIDRSGNGNTGTMASNPVAALGKIGQALEFDGADDELTASAASSMNNIFAGGGTFSAWVRPRSAGENSLGRITQRDGTGYWYVATNDVSGGATRILFEQGFTGGAGWGSWNTNYIIPLNEWSHIVVVYDKNSAANNPQMYVNGVSTTVNEAQDPVGGTAGTDTGDLHIGNTFGATRTYDGAIDDVRIYNRALSASEVMQLYRLGAN
jgi:hypothetical protein